MFRFALTLFFTVIVVVLPAGAGTELVSVRTAKGAFEFSVELADTPEEREFGLMYRRELAADAGMLFDFGKPRPVSMWMKNTLIPLDMLFLKSDGRIANIIQRAAPGSLDARTSAGAVLAVLEVNGGTAERLGIRPGDHVVHRIFGNAE